MATLKKYPKKPKSKTAVSKMTLKQIETFNAKIKEWEKACSEIDRQNNAQKAGEKKLKSEREKMKKKVANLGKL